MLQQALQQVRESSSASTSAASTLPTSNEFDITWVMRWSTWASQTGKSDLTNLLSQYSAAYGLLGKGNLQQQQAQPGVVALLVTGLLGWFQQAGIDPLAPVPAVPPPAPAPAASQQQRYGLHITGDVNAGQIILGDSNTVIYGNQPSRQTFFQDRQPQRPAAPAPPFSQPPTSGDFPWDQFDEEVEDSAGNKKTVIAEHVDFSGTNANTVICKTADLSGSNIRILFVLDEYDTSGCQIGTLVTVRRRTKSDSSGDNIKDEKAVSLEEWYALARAAAGV